MKNRIQQCFTASLLLVLMCAIFMPTSVVAQRGQSTITGLVTDVDGEPLAGANIRVKGKVIGTSTDTDGEFELNVRLEPPFTLVFSIVGFISQEVEITESNVTGLNIALEEQLIFGDDVVVSASRVEENYLESPVTIEKLDAIAIQETPATSFYDAIINLKGVDFSAQSLTFKSVNTRGFAANGNTRFVQLIDGIDNQAPGLNFPVGNVVGISELDLESAELIPGVASALYGPNALNGILLLNSKSPFDYQGLSVSVKQGINHIDNEDDDASLYQDYSARYANVVNDRFAYKFNVSYLRANDFIGSDFRDRGPATFGAIERGATERGNNRVYNGLNVYGDDVLTIGTIADAQIAAGTPGIAEIRSLLPDGALGAFSSLGYTEASFVDNTTESLKLGGALHYRLTNDLEVLGQFNWGSGSTVYTANDRFVLDNFSIWTAKLELRNPNYFLRAYTTQEDAGDSYAANTLATLINLETYVPTYFATFAGARTQGATVDQAHAAAAAQAELSRVEPGSAAFNSAAERIRNTPISEGGAQFLDQSDMYHVEGYLNMAEYIDPSKLGVIVGANYRQFALNSQGTLFALQDNGDEFTINEYGAYMQLSKSLMDDALDLQGSVRYDKNEYFDGQFSPRVSAVYTLAEKYNFRASFQRGFRIPTNQDQFIDLDVVTRRLIGSNPALVDRYNFESNTVYESSSVEAARVARAGGATAAEARAFLNPVQFEDFEPEKVNTFEVGFKTLIGERLLFDAYYFYSSYTDFIAEIDFTQAVTAGDRDASDGFSPAPGFDALTNDERQDAIINDAVAGGRLQRYGFDINADGNVEAQGWAASLDYTLNGGYGIGGNVAYNELISQQDLIDQGFRASFNTPKWRYNLKFYNREVIDNLGFNVTYRWQDAFLWESSFGQGVVPAFNTLDAQISLKLPGYNSIVKFGASNLLNNRYETSLGNPTIGAVYYVSITFDEFLN